MNAWMVALRDQVDAAKQDALPGALTAAAVIRQLFDALVAEGFTDEEALGLVHLILGVEG